MNKPPDYEALIQRIKILEQELVQQKKTEAALRKSIDQFQPSPTHPTIDPERELAEANAKLIREIEQRKMAETALREREEKFRTIFENFTDVYFETGLDGKIINSSPSGAAFSGYSLDELIGNQVDILYNNPSDREGLLQELKAHGKVREYEMLFKRKDGSTYHVSINADLSFNEDGLPEGMKGTIRDISDYKRTKEMLIQTEKMRSVHGLAAGMAHEINNPLAGILQNTQVMRNRLTPGLPMNQQVAEECHTTIEKIEAYLEKRGIFPMMDSVYDSGRRAAKIVANMLSFSHKDKPFFSHQDPAMMLDKAFELAKNDYELKKNFNFHTAEIIREYDENVPEVWCDPGKMQQVFFNIIKNGVQAMIEADAQNPQFVFRKAIKGDVVRIEMKNNGPTIDEPVRRRVFEPFFTTRPVGAGAGLGLTVSYYIIHDDHKGTIAVESAPDIGTVFIIELPLKKR